MKFEKMSSTLIALCFAIVSTAFASAAFSGQSLEDVLSAQEDDVKARYEYRHPKETLEFFGIEPGMKVGEALPGGGWYSKILLSYLGAEGHLLGVDYTVPMYALFNFTTPESVEAHKNWPDTWPAKAQGWAGEHGASAAAARFDSVPDDAAGTIDAVLFIRALHNIARFQEQGGYLDEALAATYKMLKPGGIVGVVQHEARPDRPDAWADGSSGYLKRENLIAAMGAAGFEFVSASDVNANDNDQAVEGDFVWRLPPTLFGVKDKPELKEKMLAIGESNRMTLKFIKPTE